MAFEKPMSENQKENGNKFADLYNYVLSNLGKIELKFEEVDEYTYFDYLKNYPRKYEHNFFMDWVDSYDFNDFKENDEIWKYRIARRCCQCGFAYYLPKMEE